MMTRLLVLAVTAMLSASACSIPGAEGQQSRPAGVLQRGKAYRFEKIKEDIYHAVGTGAMTVGANSAIIINDSDVMLVDSHMSPAAAWVLLDELKEITPKPVRYVVNTHFHYDHSDGNQVFGRDVEIIGHEFTRQVLTGNVRETRLLKAHLEGIPGQVESLKKRLADETDPARKTQLLTQLESAQNHQASMAEFRPTPPTVTLNSRMTIVRGNREIQLLFFGRGHTGGDVVVYLPRERVLATGDLLTATIANMTDGFANEWVTTLDEVKKLDFDIVLPGHGAAFTGKAKFDHFQSYLRDIWTQVSRFKQQGLPAEEAARRIDMSAHKANYPNIQSPGVDVRAVVRIYEVMEMNK
jgi:glyoxylase-like metal-dependent hydrolase (beta-lactamase superfamily II)